MKMAEPSKIAHAFPLRPGVRVRDFLDAAKLRRQDGKLGTVAGVFCRYRPGSLSAVYRLNNERERRIGFDVQMATGAATEDEVGNYVGVYIGQYWDMTTATETEADITFCSEAAIRQNGENAKVWTVDYTFSTHPQTKPAENTSDPANPNMFLRPAEISWAYEQHNTPLEQGYLVDDDGPASTKTPVRNSAGGRFARVPMNLDAYQVLRIVRNEPTFPRSLARTYRFVSNSDTFQGDAAGQWLCKPIIAQWIFEQVPAGTAIPNQYGGGSVGASYVGYFRVTYELLWSEDGWDLDIDDEGTEYYDPATGKLTTPVDANGVAIRGLVALDGNGGRLADTDLYSNGPVVRTYRAKAWQAFSALNLPDPCF
jgi:hypothetical protein